MVPKDTMTLSEASTYLAIDAEVLARLAAERSIPSMEVNGQWIFSKKSIDKWRRVKASQGK
ncbi:MAG: helix-turn-helix domain-containing protein [Candidatus Rokubacteria bacterium]|nr:helix-turn-helix domain-containing protein [Candidatus Rokubacteria bacterium]